MKVVYGHTDSIYVEIDSIEKAKETVEHLNKEVRKIFPNILGLEEHPVTLEFEKYFKTLGVGTTKNRNAGLITWKDGEYLDEDEFVMTGFTAKRISETNLAKEVQIKTLTMWAENKSEEEIVEYLRDKYHSVKYGQIDIEDVLKRTRYKPERFSVKCKTCSSTSTTFDLMEQPCCSTMNLRTLEGKRASVREGIEGVLYRKYVDDLDISDSYLFMKVSNNTQNTKITQYLHPTKQVMVFPSYISGLTVDEMKNYTPDWEHYAESVVKKAEPIFRAMGWKISQIKHDQNQRSLMEWF